MLLQAALLSFGAVGALGNAVMETLTLRKVRHSVPCLTYLFSSQVHDLPHRLELEACEEAVVFPT
jgi:hypothetical protein